MALHSCPNCTCKPRCEVCHDTGMVPKSEKMADWTGPDGQPQGSWTYSVEPCPKGCPAPMAFYPASFASGGTSIVDARARTTRTVDL